ncbi:tetratricopeptide repeat protein [Catellatospora tritici]|uniref:tetratricopeptide repeat protein n=1 Tax=Catellatospora tritici TaxID=2851566 RepID=UPI001C2D7B24|nr:tetratricopeptide repeat protein [Catellatospora tritici]MBV1850017.1 tetratricopeptide repeat protein [Catellatospora tritici]
MSGHVFISYSHATDSAYVAKLAKHFTAAGVEVWFDHQIITGERWAKVIQQRIDTCAAFIVVMSPASDQSTWVDREIDQAELRGKPIFPLLLGGERFFRLAHLQFEDVTGGRMPSAGLATSLLGWQTATRAAAAGPAAAVGAATPDRRHSDDALGMRKRDGRGEAAQPLDHATLKARHNAAFNIGRAGNRAEAARLFRALVADSIRVLGPDHPDTLNARYWLALNTHSAGDGAEVTRMFHALVADSTRVLGADHPDTLSARYWLATNTDRDETRAEATELFRALVADNTRVRGADHPDTLRARSRLALNVGQGGDRAEAARMYRALVADYTRVRGADHPDTLSARHWLALNIGDGGDRTEAARLFRALVADSTRVRGADHPDTLSARYWLAYNIGQGGKGAEAARMFRVLVADSTRVLGAGHPDTESARFFLESYGSRAD